MTPLSLRLVSSLLALLEVKLSPSAVQIEWLSQNAKVSKSGIVSITGIEVSDDKVTWCKPWISHGHASVNSHYTGRRIEVLIPGEGQNDQPALLPTLLGIFG